MFYVIQENTFKEVHYDLLLELMAKYGLEYEIVKYIPFTHQVDFKTQRKDVFCWGSISMTQTAAIYGWKPGSMYNANHDFEIYGPRFGFENMLNGDHEVINFTDPVPERYEEFFVRPTMDLKVFTAEIHTQESWKKYVDGCIENNTADIISDQTKVLVSSYKEIQQEVRCWVVGGRVVSASRYKLGRRVTYKNYDDEAFYVEFAQRMADKFQPAEAFVLDICLADDELKVIEVNSINCAGFYHCNMDKLIRAIEDHFNPATAKWPEIGRKI